MSGKGGFASPVSPLKYIPAAALHSAINTSLKIIEMLRILSVPIARQYVTGESDITVRMALYDLLRGLLPTVAGTWNVPPAYTENITDEDPASCTNDFRGYTTSDDTCTLTWDLGAQYTALIHIKAVQYVQNSSYVGYLKLKGSVDGAAWTEIAAWSTTSSTPIFIEVAYRNQSYRYLRTTHYATYVSWDYSRLYELAAFRDDLALLLLPNRIMEHRAGPRRGGRELVGFYAQKASGSGLLYYTQAYGEYP